MTMVTVSIDAVDNDKRGVIEDVRPWHGSFDPTYPFWTIVTSTHFDL